MARTRLNKKVVLIGSLFFAVFAVGVIVLILRFTQGPEKFIEDGDAAWKVKDYESAERNYLKANSRAKNDSLRVELLLKLIDVYLEIEKWPQVRGCWGGVIKLDPENLYIRYAQLKYFYIIANGGVNRLWKDVEAQATEFLKIIEEKDLLAEDTAQWESPLYEKVGMTHPILAGADGVQRIGPYLYLLKGRAALEIARMGAVTDPNKTLVQALEDLQKVQELDPSNVDAAWHLSRAVMTGGEFSASRGNVEEREKARQRVLEILEQTVAFADQNLRAHLNLLLMKQRSKITEGAGREEIKAFEKDYVALTEKFSSNAESFLSLSNFYRFLGADFLGKAVEAVEKAVELDKENAGYAINAADLHHLNFSINGEDAELYKAIETAKHALTLPSAQDTAGPQQVIRNRYRIALYSLLARFYVEELLEPSVIKTESERQQWLADAEKTVRQIEQMYGSGENPQVMKWQGILELAKGNKFSAIKKLYAAYKQLEASNVADIELSYTLAKHFGNTTELGVAAEFFVSALNLEDRSRSGIDARRPEALLDYTNVLIRLKNAQSALRTVDFFENMYGANDRSKTLRIEAYILAGQFDDAEKSWPMRVWMTRIL